nr:hypothetical protein CFP56_52146 [Quercus suber]
MSPELAAALSAYAIATDGNVVEGVWSIGGPLPKDDLTGALLGTGQGLSYSHNSYEARGDAYTNHGDAHSLNVTKFERVYAVGGPEDRYTLDKFRARFEEVQDEAIANNPYFFTGAFSTVVVVPAAYNFGGFHSILYRRPSTNKYTGVDVFADVAIGYAAYPRTLRFGGNVGKPNTFTGLDVGDLTGGLYNVEDLFEGDNLACFSYSVLQQGIPDFLDTTLNALAPVTDLINKYVSPIIPLNCSQITNQTTSIFQHFPGYTYRPNGPATNYKL